jgi:flagellin-like hook-associated protein FlgL
LPDVSLSSLGLDDLNLSDTDLLLSKIEVAVDKVSGERSRIGGLENIFRDILLTQDIYKQNLEETDARLLLTDIIQEVSNLGREKALLLLGTSLIGEMSNILREIKLAGYNIGR